MTVSVAKCPVLGFWFFGITGDWCWVTIPRAWCWGVLNSQCLVLDLLNSWCLVLGGVIPYPVLCSAPRYREHDSIYLHWYQECGVAAAQLQTHFPRDFGRLDLYTLWSVGGPKSSQRMATGNHWVKSTLCFLDTV